MNGVKSLTFALIVGIILLSISYATPAMADPAAGDACATAGAVARTGGAESSGVGSVLVCQGGTWKAAVGFNGSGQLTTLGNQTCTTDQILKFDGTKWACADDNEFDGVSCSFGETAQRAASGWRCTCDSWYRLFPVPDRRYYTGADISADGQKIVITAYDSPIYLSNDGGLTWSTKETARAWYSIDMSDDGTKIAATVRGGQIYVSTDGGATWTARASNQNWGIVTMSASGVRMAAAVENGNIYVSTNTGSSWSSRASVKNWQEIDMSNDGMSMVASAMGDYIYTSTNGGLTWTARNTAEGTKAYVTNAISGDGVWMVAADWGSGSVYGSIDSGANWSLFYDGYPTVDLAASKNGTDKVILATGLDPSGVWAYDGATSTWYNTNPPTTSILYPKFYPGSNNKVILVGGEGEGVWISGCINVLWD